MGKLQELEIEKQITPEELTSLQESVNNQNQLQMQIGGLEGHKATLIDKLKQVVSDLNVTQSALEDKYGSVNISLATGTISYVAETN